jgi:hypothetical protein
MKRERERDRKLEITQDGYSGWDQKFAELKGRNSMQKSLEMLQQETPQKE